MTQDYAASNGVARAALLVSETDGFSQPTSGARVGEDDVARLALAAYRDRRRRDAAFGDDVDMFGEAAWDIMLDLLNAEGSNTDICITSACIGACVPQSTAARAILQLEQRGYVEKASDRVDRRRSFLLLTNKGRYALMRALRDRVR